MRTDDTSSVDRYVDLRVVIGTLWAGRWWISLSVAIFGAIFAGAAMTMTPVYRVTTVLAPVDINGKTGSLGSSLGQFGGLAALAGLDLSSGGSAVEESLAVLRSRDFTERFIGDYDLMPELFEERWSATRWLFGGEATPTLAQGYKLFDRRIRTVFQDSKTGLVRLQVEWRDPDRAAFWANEMIARLNAEMRMRAIANTSAAVGYLEKELAATTFVDTKAAIGRLIETQINQRMLANVTQEYAFRIVDRALPPDADDIARPRKLLMLLFGVALGLLIGSLAVAFMRPLAR